MRPGQNVRGKDCTGDASALDASSTFGVSAKNRISSELGIKQSECAVKKKVAVKSGLSASVHPAKCIEDCSTSVHCAVFSIQCAV